jgi:type II secretory pathway pseudopilin PulG
MVFISVMSVGLLVALPVWHTQMQRELEEELIFRGLQYVEAIRIYQTKNPGAFPGDLEELVKKRYLRKLYPDPMTKDGRWNVILQQGGMAGPAAGGPGRGRTQRPSETTPGAPRLLIAPLAALSSIQNPRLIGVVSSSPRKSFRIYEENETYDTWLFYYGRDPAQKPEIVRFGQPMKRP